MNNEMSLKSKSMDKIYVKDAEESINGRRDEKQISEEADPLSEKLYSQYLSNSSERVLKAILYFVREARNSNEPLVKIDYRSLYLNFYDNEDNFVYSIVPMKRSFKVLLKGFISDDISFESIKIRDVANKGHWGLGEVEMDILRSLPPKKVIDIIKSVTHKYGNWSLDQPT